MWRARASGSAANSVSYRRSTMVLLSRCCLCLSLRTGSFIIGCLHLIAALIVIAICIAGLVDPQGTVDWARVNMDLTHEVEPDDIYPMLITNLVFSFVILVIICLLLHGANVEKRHFLIPYIVLACLEVVVPLTVGIVLLVVSIVRGLVVTGIIYFFSYLISGLISLYMLFVVASFYHELLQRAPTYYTGIYKT